MADFKKHTSVGLLWGLLISIVCFFAGYIDILQGVVATVLGIIGSGLPDIDSDTARPRRIILGILGITVPVILASSHFKGSRVETIFCIVLFSYLFLQYVLSYVFAKYTKHRGLFHSIPMMVLFGELTFLMFSDSINQATLVYAGACAGGYLSHLILDEIYSVDIMGCSIKRSFGTALCFKGDSFLRNMILYLLIIVCGILCFFK